MRVWAVLRLERANNHGGVVGLRQLGRQLHVEVAQEVRPNGLDLDVRKLLSAAPVTSAAESKPSVALAVAAEQTSCHVTQARGDAASGGRGRGEKKRKKGFASLQVARVLLVVPAIGVELLRVGEHVLQHVCKGRGYHHGVALGDCDALEVDVCR